MSSENLQVVASQGSRGRLLTVPKFQEAVRSEPSPALIVDFRDVSYLDSSGLRAVIAAYVSA